MVTKKIVSRLKSSLHVSVDAELKGRIQAVAQRMSIPVSHLTSLSLSRAVRQFEDELALPGSKIMVRSKR